jgi:hypothetical protein
MRCGLLAGDWLSGQQIILARGATRRLGATSQQPALSLTHRIMASYAERPSLPHGSARENGTRSGVGEVSQAVAAQHLGQPHRNS